jgi:hypothetical protein
MVRSTVAHLFLMLHFESLWVNASHHDPITNEDKYEATKYDYGRLIHCILQFRTSLHQSLSP